MELTTILNTMSLHKLTFDEYMLVYLTFLAQDEESHPEYFSQWFNNGGCNNLKDLFNSLKDKNIISKNYNPESYVPNDIQFNKSFIKSFFKHSGFLGEELFNKYPPFIEINGKTVSIRNIGKKFFSLEEFYFYYGKTIAHCPKKHKEIMEILEWAIEEEHINYGLLEFVASQKWVELQQLRNGEITNIYSVPDIYTTM